VRNYSHTALAVLCVHGFYIALSARESAQAFQLLLAQDCSRSSVARLIVRSVVTVWPRRQLKDGILLHTSHSGGESDRYFRGLRRRNVGLAFMVHDLIPLTHAEYCRAGIAQVHEERVRTALRYSGGIIANSQATLDSLFGYASRARLPLPKTVVARLAPAMSRGHVAARPIDAPYFVMLGTIEPRKNHWLILHVWRRLVEQLGTAAPKLVVIGRRGWECENVVDMLERCTSIQGSVIEEMDCSDERLHSWLRHAQALVFPSFAEGYGIPIAEALAERVPVLASDLGVFREFAGDIPDYLDPLDGPAWFARILAYARPDSPERKAQLARIERFREPTWAEHFENVDRLLNALKSPA
jgi:glycosyltransferase involved in cell wall biosynthesis